MKNIGPLPIGMKWEMNEKVISKFRENEDEDPPRVESDCVVDNPR